MGAAIFPSPPQALLEAPEDPWGCVKPLRVPGQQGWTRRGRLIADSPKKPGACHPPSPGQPAQSCAVVSVPALFLPPAPC